MRIFARYLSLLVTLAAALVMFTPVPASADTAQVDVRMVVILVDFNNVQMSMPDTFWRDRMFGDVTGSAHDYYREATYGKYRITPASETFGDADDGVVHIALSELHPGGEASLAYPMDIVPAARRAVTAADAYLDFSAFDTDADGMVASHELQIALVFAGYEGSDSRAGRPAIWANAAHDMLRGVSLDGVELTEYFAQGELYTQAGDPLGIATLCHELGHTLGLDDLYDVTGRSIGLGTSSLMASGVNLLDGNSPAHFDPYCLIKLGVITPTVVTTDSVVTLHASDTPSYNIVKVPITEDGEQYFLLENRRTNGYDSGLRDDPRNGGTASGVAIYHIDEWVMDTWVFAVFGEQRTANSNYLRKGVDLEEADGPALDQGWNAPHGGDHYFYDGHATEFGPNTYPNSNAYMDTLDNGTTIPTGVRIRVSGESGDEMMQVTITFEPDAPVAPDFPGGIGTATSPYHITNAAELDKVRRYPEAHFVLKNDIEFTEADYAPGGAFSNRGAGFRPLFGGSQQFRGSFDGAGHEIRGLRMHVSGNGDTLAGLFGGLSGSVKNLSLVCDITAESTAGSSFAGGLAAKAVTATVKNCSVAGTVNADVAGGVFGSGSASVISDCRNAAAVSSDARYDGGHAGGIAGQAARTTRVSRCSNQGAIQVSSSLASEPEHPEGLYAGGIAGRVLAASTISQCFNAGEVTAITSEQYPNWCSAWAGGIAGACDFDCKATDCYNAGDIAGMHGSSTAGIVGHTGAATLARCYNVGAIQQTGWYGGIAAGALSEGADKIARCYYADTADHAFGFGIDGPVPEEVAKPGSLTAMETQEHFAGFDFENVWAMAGESGYPYPQLRTHRQALAQPGAPNVRAAAVRYDRVQLTWDVVADAARYEIYRATASSGPYTKIAVTTATSHLDPNRATGTRYFYRARSVASAGGLVAYGEWSNTASATPVLGRVAKLTVVKASSRSTRASWSAVTGASGYELYRATSSRGTYRLVKRTTLRTFTNSGLTARRTYYYKVRAYHLEGTRRVYGPFSSIVGRRL